MKTWLIVLLAIVSLYGNEKRLEGYVEFISQVDSDNIKDSYYTNKNTAGVIGSLTISKETENSNSSITLSNVLTNFPVEKINYKKNINVADTDNIYINTGTISFFKGIFDSSLNKFNQPPTATNIVSVYNDSQDKGFLHTVPGIDIGYNKLINNRYLLTMSIGVGKILIFNKDETEMGTIGYVSNDVDVKFRDPIYNFNLNLSRGERWSLFFNYIQSTFDIIEVSTEDQDPALLYANKHYEWKTYRVGCLYRTSKYMLGSEYYTSVITNTELPKNIYNGGYLYLSYFLNDKLTPYLIYSKAKDKDYYHSEYTTGVHYECNNKTALIVEYKNTNFYKTETLEAYNEVKDSNYPRYNVFTVRMIYKF